MTYVFIDFETYYSAKDYTLSKMGPVTYIRDPRFEVLCCGLQIDNGATFVVEGEDIYPALRELVYSGAAFIGHNIAGFDNLILTEHYKLCPAIVYDTIPMMHWLGLSRIMSCTHKDLTAALGHGKKLPGTVVSNGKHRQDFTPEEWEFFTGYCADDVHQCALNFYSMQGEVMKTVGGYDAMQVINFTAQMAARPAFIPNGVLLDQYQVELQDEARQAWEKLRQYFSLSSVDDLMSLVRKPSWFATALQAVAGYCPMKYSDKQGKDVPAISKSDLEFIDMQDSSNPAVAMLVSARLNLNSNIRQTRAARLASPYIRDRAVPILLSAYKAHTGRYTAGGEGATDRLNFQNFNKRDPSQRTLRRALKVAPGYKVVACDSSQIEARVLAWVAQQEDLVQQFANGDDPYSEMAAKIFHENAGVIHAGAKHNDDPRHDALKMERNVGKTAVLQLGYGSSAAKFSSTLLRTGVRLAPDNDAHAVQAVIAHKIYRAVNNKIVAFWAVCQSVLTELLANRAEGEHGSFGRDGLFTYGWGCVPCTKQVEPYIALPNGYRLWYPGLRTEESEFVYDQRSKPVRIYGGKVTENLCQSLAFHLLTWQACRMVEDKVPLKANIHDAWIAVVPDNYVDACKTLMEHWMGAVPAWMRGFPVACEAEVGDDFTIA